MRAGFTRSPFLKISPMGMAAVLVLIPGLAFGQARGGTTGSAGGSAGTRSAGPTGAGPSPVTQPGGPMFLSGKVVLDDGTPLPEPVKIERVCNGNARVEAFADHKGRFSFQIGQSLEMQDVSDGTFDTGSRINTSGTQNFPGMNSSNSVTEKSLWGCDLRATLPGYRSDVLSLSTIHYMDNPDIGTIIMHRVGNSEGLTVSATTALAPKEAKKAFDKGLDLIAKHNDAEAQKNFEKAAALYPKYAAAWFELGKLNEQKDQTGEAQKNYKQAVEADDKYIPPYDRLAWIAMKQTKWQELADLSDRLVHLDPLSYPDAYYLNSVANYQLQHYEAAEKSAREAIRLDAKKNAQSYYVLGLTLAMRHNYAASAESLKAFIDASPKGADLEGVRKQLQQVEEAAALQPTPAAPPNAPPNAGPPKQEP